MARRLDARDPGFAAAFAEALSEKRETAADVGEVVADIIADVRRRGDEALFEYTKRFDRLSLDATSVRIDAAEIEAARAETSSELLAALDTARERISAYHRHQMPDDLAYRDDTGVELGARWRPLAEVGLYVPGGTAAYPSSVLMNALPAMVAGVERLAMVTPTPDGKINPLVLAAASASGIKEIYRVGGAQAVAALTYGTASIAPVDKVVGPGNAYVAAAKRQVFGTVGIDLIAGPSEVLVVADADNEPRWIALDLLAQAEHDTASQSILITDDASFADRVEAAVVEELATLPRANIAAASWRDHGLVILVSDLADTPPLIDRVAPEHLELAVADPDVLADRVRHAGAIFLGRYTPEAISDYVAGPNHVLPTARSARFSSGLSVLDFVKRSSIVRCDSASVAALAPAARALAEAEGLDAHARSIAVRLADPR
jgi:histidinol dehydrogenase